MTTLDITQLEGLASLDFESFKALDTQYQNRASLYYTTVASQAENAGLLHVENYAILAKDVINNSSTNGVLANEFTSGVADKLHVDFSNGSDNRLRMQYELMQADVAARKANILRGGTGELSAIETNQIHATALAKIGLPPEAYSLYAPISQVAEHDPAKAQFIFQTVLWSTPILESMLRVNPVFAQRHG